MHGYIIGGSPCSAGRGRSRSSLRNWWSSTGTTRYGISRWISKTSHILNALPHNFPPLAHTAGHKKSKGWVIFISSFQFKLCFFNFLIQGKGQSIDSEMEEDENQPLDLSWPDSWRERVTYLLFLPIIIPLYITLPDTRKQSGIRSLFYLKDNQSRTRIYTINHKDYLHSA